MEDVYFWWENLSEEEQRSLEIDYGYYGHDEGLTYSEIKFMYDEEHKMDTEY